jgi:hypothetical protein
VHADATFHNFYKFYRQHGARRSTKELIRVASRNEGLPLINSLAHKPGLELIKARLEAYGAPSNPVVKSSMRIIRKRVYRKLINMRPDELGLTKVPPSRIPLQRYAPTRIPITLPAMEVA